MDEIIRAVTKDGFVKISAISARGVVERAREIHGLAPTAAAALGRTLCGASMLGELMKEEDASLTIRVNGGGPIGSVIAVSDCDGNVRGYVTEPKTDLPLRPDGKLNVGGAVGTDGMPVSYTHLEPRSVSTSMAARLQQTQRAERTKTALQSSDAVRASSPSNMSPPPQAMASASGADSASRESSFSAAASEKRPSRAAQRSVRRHNSPRYAPEVIFS